jgi:hypothetical protein
VTGSGAAPGSQTYEGMEAVATLGPARPRQPLRRPFASILAEINLPPRRAMYLIGHTDPTLTMPVYQQVIDMGNRSLAGTSRKRLKGLEPSTFAWQADPDRPLLPLYPSISGISAPPTGHRLSPVSAPFAVVLAPNRHRDAGRQRSRAPARSTLHG